MRGSDMMSAGALTLRLKTQAVDNAASCFIPRVNFDHPCKAGTLTPMFVVKELKKELKKDGPKTQLGFMNHLIDYGFSLI